MSALFAKHRESYPVGTLAYIDSFGGLIKCKVVDGDGDDVRVIITGASLAGYRKGESYWRNVSYVVPRDRVRRSGGTYRIRNGWRYLS